MESLCPALSLYPKLSKNTGWHQEQKKQIQLMAKTFQSFVNSPDGRRVLGQDDEMDSEVECHLVTYGAMFVVGNKRDLGEMRAVTEPEARQFAEQRNVHYFDTSELTRIGIETVKKELAEGKVPKVPKAEQHEAKKVQPFGNCSFEQTGFVNRNANQRAQKDRQEQLGISSFNLVSDSDVGVADDCGGGASSKANVKGKNGGKNKKNNGNAYRCCIIM